MFIEIAVAVLVLAVVVLTCVLAGLRRDVTQIRHDLDVSVRKQDDEKKQHRARIRMLVAVALGQLHEDVAVEPLIQGLQDEDVDLARVAAAVLPSQGARVIEPVSKVGAENRAMLPLAISVISRCVKTEQDLLAAAKAGGHSVDFAKSLLDHEVADETVFSYLAENGPIGLLGYLAAMERAQGTPAQATAQRRLQEEAKRRKEAEDRRKLDEAESYDDSDYGYEKGTCDCRWR